MRSVVTPGAREKPLPPITSVRDDVPSLPIGALSKQTGCNIETIRFYEKIAMLPKPARTEGGRRIYSQQHVERLSFIRRARALGFTLNQVRTLLSLSETHDHVCMDVKEVASAHLADVRRKITDLHAMEAALHGFVLKCGEGTMASCPLIEALVD
jgi:MerR family mercuric resistance operon transcriptional regulator